MSINVANSILIFDEAHNIEGSCEDAMSFELSTEKLALCVEELAGVCEYHIVDDIDREEIPVVIDIYVSVQDF